MKHEWHLKRNCSLSPSQVAKAYGLLCVFTLAVGAGFLVVGIPYVIVFSIIEISAVGIALLFYARHATDHEHIALADNCLLIERIEAGALQQVRLDPYWTRIRLPNRRRALIELESRGVKVEVGGFISEEERHTVAEEMRTTLRAASAVA
jgi:uncharacterized membrane protein